MYWQIGKVIFEEEQQGKDRADYGTYLIKSISTTFQPQMGSGFSVRQLEMNRQFYRMFPNTSALRTQFNWTRYKLLLSVDKEEKRAFYIAEAEKNNWTARQLERQINSLFIFNSQTPHPQKTSLYHLFPDASLVVFVPIFRPISRYVLVLD